MLINSTGQNMPNYQNKSVNEVSPELKKAVDEKAVDEKAVDGGVSTMGVGGGNDQEVPDKPK